MQCILKFEVHYVRKWLQCFVNISSKKNLYEVHHYAWRDVKLSLGIKIGILNFFVIYKTIYHGYISLRNLVKAQKFRTWSSDVTYL